MLRLPATIRFGRSLMCGTLDDRTRIRPTSAYGSPAASHGLGCRTASCYPEYSEGIAERTAPLITTLADRKRQRIETALAQMAGPSLRRERRSQKAGVPRQTLDAKIATLGIDKYRFKSR
jgi:DNA-binding NtrC family response regulator